MLRQIHSLPGLVAALLVAVLALTGAVLSVQPALERLAAPSVVTGTISVAALAEAARAQHAEIDKIVKTASGSLVVSYFEGDKAGADLLDPATGRVVAPHTPSPTIRFITNLHRSLLVGTAGRVAAGLGALAMVVLTVTGAMMLAARQGGWSAWLRPIRGSARQRWHAQTGRLAIVGLLLTAMTGCFLSLTSFELIPDGSADPVATSSGGGGERASVGSLGALQAVDLADLRELAFPYAADPTDTYRLTTAAGVTQIDAATGQALSFQPHSTARQLYELIYMLHTGQGLWPLSLLLGLSALAVPVFAVTGAMIWWQRRRSLPRITDNRPAAAADTIILVGSEGNSTWGFARTLHAALTQAGHKVHAAPMNALAPAYPKAARMLILTATYGDGMAPASASGFLARLDRSALTLPVAVLGFGDRSFPRFCGFAEDIGAALAKKGWPALIEIDRIDRQSAQSFALWGDRLGKALGHALTLAHVAERPKTTTLELVKRVDYGAEVQAPTAILTFRLPGAAAGRPLWERLFPASLPPFEAGDLVGILPPGSTVPRYYSLASSAREGILEICVRKQPGGLCSGFLNDLPLGGRIDGFIKANPAFRPNAQATPLILIGTGAGIAPLMGFLRANRSHREAHLYWGGRSPASDFLYRNDLASCMADGRLTALNAVFSRVAAGGYVQDGLASDGPHLAALLQRGAQIMVCGGREMAGGVSQALDAILAPMGLSTIALKASGLYLEDVY
ncbi:PepSY domain-containing protein [Bosea sp. (in: a-proteobacteria)]|uniref:PepSY domain-containing protein n=1 Tax=Bosea sp. (in: a-proteobacteria) TaxID=1871050 RepID=UPI002B478CBB|nr:PepSY domain-containing protein [Bosea sp. (in: a-proteobacteria)]WRH58421.1 MAG: PepSY domain-containing protein [Bosea sp. (in: a-proteobacteria)]